MIRYILGVASRRDMGMMGSDASVPANESI